MISYVDSDHLSAISVQLKTNEFNQNLLLYCSNIPEIMFCLLKRKKKNSGWLSSRVNGVWSAHCSKLRTALCIAFFDDWWKEGYKNQHRHTHTHRWIYFLLISFVSNRGKYPDVGIFTLLGDSSSRIAIFFYFCCLSCSLLHTLTLGNCKKPAEATRLINE